MRGVDPGTYLCDNSLLVRPPEDTVHPMNTQWISVKVHPNAGKEMLVTTGGGRFEAWVKAKPIAGDANEAVASLLARSLRVPAAQIRLIKGRSGRHKVFKVMGA